MTSGTEAAESASRRESRAEARAQAKQLRKVAEALADRHVKKVEAETAQRVREVEAQTRQRLQEIDARIAERKRAAEAAAAPGEPPTDATADAETAAPSADEPPSEDAARPPERQASSESALAEPETAEQRMARRIRDVEAAAQGKDSGTSLAAAIAALVMEATVEVDDEESPGASGKHTGASEEDAEAGEDTRAAKAPREGRDFWRVNGFSVWSLAFWAALFAALQLAQWVVIALSRDYHDAISRKASLLTGLEPEEEDVQPRVRLNVPWLRKKVKRRWRAFLLLMVGVPALVVVTLPFMCASHAVFTTLFALWSAWWFVVFTAAKSARAWEPTTGPARPPWFLRAWTTLTTRVPGLRWGALQRYGASWGRRTEEVFAPVASAERYPWVFAGLSVVRFLGSFPPMKFFVRPLIPVASAHLLTGDVAAAKRALAKEAEASPAAAEVPRPSDVW
ncbi:hypothetical protein [Corallococcus macrosporus]|uniref:Uncharacterized protein n=1 Tax=Myxococcus fulvus (strain ATCC BAA-855 / HW-1) TaxID=483219 RepID=F8CBU2_MYXFH|nr:hypothetical protein [Corallococcus macrosporus]AEI65908.1 hypothetical protein LILAB_20030 [Corallococcus macrosporus]